MSAKTKTVHHPTLSGVSYEVPEDAAKGWKEQGWRFTDPKLPTPPSAPEPAEAPVSE
jgi:hypothetical protein